MPKLSPVTTTRFSADRAVFRSTYESVGASKESKLVAPVPTSDDTVTPAYPRELRGQPALLVGSWHCTVVAEVHAVLRAPYPSTAALADKSADPKFSPVTVTELRPLEAMFRNAVDSTGLSYEKNLGPVPVSRFTVRANVGSSRFAVMQLTDVDDDHELVRQSLERTVSVAVSSNQPKLRPVTLMDDPPVSGELPTT